MFEKPLTHFSFIVRCWRDETAGVHGWLVDVYTGQARPFHSLPSLVESIEVLLSAYPVVSEKNMPDGSDATGSKGGCEKIAP
jgi:hypothetical protein